MYVNDVLKNGYFPEINAIAGKDWSFQQDGAPSRRSLPAMAFLKRHTPAFIKNWPPNSPDLNPLDYAIWSILASDVNAQGPKDHSELRAAVTRAVRNLGQGAAGSMCSQIAKRPELCVQRKGGRIEHML